MKQSLEEYLTEIGRKEMLLKEEEDALSMAIQEKGPDCKEVERLVQANLRFVVAVANQYQGRGLTIEELIEAGNEGLRKAAETYVPDADSKFIRYAVPWVRQSIIQAIEENKQ
jgi:DNA-directed RNA polymerase sigma subunit (sigma70/sigma32)